MRHTLAALFGLGLGIAGSQVPEYAQQYEQRLGGAVTELKAIVARFDTAAQKAGLTRSQALATYQASDNGFLRDQGADMAQTLARYDRLSSHLAALERDGAVQRVADLARYFDPAIAQGTLERFKPAVPVTFEGLAYAGLGGIAGYAGTIGAGGALARRRRRRGAHSRETPT